MTKHVLEGMEHAGAEKADARVVEWVLGPEAVLTTPPRRRPSGAKPPHPSLSPSWKTLPPGLHDLAVPGLRTLLTPGMPAVGDALREACAQRARSARHVPSGALREACAQRCLVCVLGDAGVGKTFAVHAAGRRLGALPGQQPRGSRRVSPTEKGEKEVDVLGRPAG